jgi:hypothetical protein
VRRMVSNRILRLSRACRMLDSVYSLSSRFWQIAIGCAKRKIH